MTNAAQHYIKTAQQIMNRAEREGRSLTENERDRAEEALRQVGDIKASEAWAEGRISDIV